MATIKPANKSGKGKRKKCKQRTLTHRAPAEGQMFPAVSVGGKEMEMEMEEDDSDGDSQGLSALHVACLHSQLASVQRLVESRPGRINSGDQQGRRPVHMLLSSQSASDKPSCLRYLLENGADVNATTYSGMTPLHLAASEGLMDCTEILIQAGADIKALDSLLLTPLDYARIFCRRQVARYLKSLEWHENKTKEMQERKRVQALYSKLVDGVKLTDLKKKTLIDVNVTEWAKKKGLPRLKGFSPRVMESQYHTQCLSSDQKTPHRKHHHHHHPVQHKPGGGPQEDRSLSARQHPASSSRPWSIFMGLQPEKAPAQPDLRSSVTVWRDRRSRQPQYTTTWDSTPRPAPDVSLDVLERVLFPRAFPSRIASPRSFEPRDIVEVQHRGYPQGRSTSPWTEVAMHLAEVLEPGHH